MRDYAVRFLIWLPDRLFVLMVRALVFMTNLFYDAAEGEIKRHKSIRGLSKKHKMALYEVFANNEAAQRKM